MSGRISSDSVYGGIPARRICSLQEYKQKREAAQLEEAFDIYRGYLNRFHQEPAEEVFREYFALFCAHDSMGNIFKSQAKLMGNFDTTVCRMKAIRRFSSYDDFLNACRRWVNE